MKQFQDITQPAQYQFDNDSVNNRLATIYDIDQQRYTPIHIEDLKWSEIACEHDGEEGTCQIGVLFYIHGDWVMEKYFKCFFPYNMKVTPPDMRVCIVGEMEA